MRDRGTAIVAGSSGTIGSAICLRLLQLHPEVVGLYRQREAHVGPATQAARKAGSRYLPLRCDLSSDAGVDHAYAEARRLAAAPEVLILAVGATARKSLLLTKPEAVRTLFEINALAPIELARRASRDMMRAGFGRIVVVGSVAGESGFPGQAAYAASKAALVAWARSAAGELGGYGITVNVVAPGALEGSTLYSEAEEARVVERIGCKRVGTADEVAAAICFLASPDASYINGAVLRVDGGAI
jgi:NAD(P)-dependent dehydrogenase (short-subunit alcohol dehydrogenase family)